MRKQPAWVWAVIAAGAVAQACLWGMVGSAWVRPPAAAGTSPAAKSTPTREEFRSKVLGKTRDQVIEAVGKPDRTTEDSVQEYWYYKGVSVDAVTGRVDASAQVVFVGGKVAAVNF